MPARTRRVHLPEASRAGFTLIEVAVAILVIALLAGAMGPLAGRALDQQREYRTRDLLRQAFEACFGSRDRRVANMRADFGFDPAAGLGSLAVMLGKAGTPWAATPAYAQNTFPSGATFLCGWNGPYWTGPVDALNQPLDAWGQPIQLTVTAGAYQVVSGGKDRLFGTGDDLAYPTVAVPYLAHSATLTLLVTKSSSNITGSATLGFLFGTSPSATARCTPALVAAPAIGALALPTRAIANTGGLATYQFNVPAGAAHLSITPSGLGSFTPVGLALDLLPGEHRTVQVTL